MPATKKAAKKTKTNSKKQKINDKSTTASGVRLDIVFVGPLLFVPSTVDGNVTDVEVLAPANGHPMGAVFVPGVIFTDAEIDSPAAEHWPEVESFSLLDPHSYAIDLTQADPKKGSVAPFPAAAIPNTNHKVKPGRKINTDWEIAIAIHGQLAGWTSHRLIESHQNIYLGSDAPTTASIAGSQRLTYNSVTGAEFCGISGEAKEYLRSNISKGGTLIILGEVPYQSTLLHERKAVDALAKLAGLDLHMIATAPIASRARVTGHLLPCNYSIIVV